LVHYYIKKARNDISKNNIKITILIQIYYRIFVDYYIYRNYCVIILGNTSDAISRKASISKINILDAKGV
jgi:hypothetical protein